MSRGFLCELGIFCKALLPTVALHASALCLSSPQFQCHSVYFACFFGFLRFDFFSAGAPMWLRSCSKYLFCAVQAWFVRVVSAGLHYT
ncbi:uncharacterized protein B0T23DRAFT_374871 [Neurospora hispaniola]|uniref:Uncharacterized protein n=1 Tax=Neurospora hispaniola TaxID=588809 RepID=A0AAJ0IDJ2_9PEZI|nr:hypothetical protein B0T23DRAFT_374871 [Neurospora hispaniola]